MRVVVAGCVLVALVGGATTDQTFAQSAREAASSPRRADGLVSIPVSRRTATQRIPYGRRIVEDTTSYSIVPYNWQGFYLGIHGGGAWGQARTENTSPFGGYDAGAPLSYTVRPSGFFAGGQFGGLLQRGNWVYGAELDVGYLGLDRALRVGDDHTAVRYDWYGTFTGRFGFAWDHALYYVKAGGAVAGITNTASDLTGTSAFNPADFSEVSRTHLGWTVGGGIEVSVAQDVSAKLEYLYMDFGSISSGNAAGDSFRHSNSAHTVKLGVNYRFGGVPLFIRF